MQDVADLLAELDYPPQYTAPYLRKLRHVAWAFPPEKRYPDLEWILHAEAGHPALLAEILKRARAEGLSGAEETGASK